MYGRVRDISNINGSLESLGSVEERSIPLNGSGSSIDDMPSNTRRRALPIVKWSLIIVCVAVFYSGAILIGISRWTRRMFGVVTVEQVLLNLDGAGQRGGGGSAMIWSGIIWGFMVPVGVASLVLASVVLCLRSLRVDGWQRRFFVSASAVVLALVPTIGVAQTSKTFGVAQYIRSIQSLEQLSDYYVVPANDQVSRLAQDNPLNLVVIYLESVEDTLADEAIFETNMLAGLQAETSDWDRVDSLTQYPGGGFTMSGIVSTQCGFPLRNGDVAAGDGDGMNSFGAEVAEYLPGGVCLGDLLAERGYKSVFMGGAAGFFSGKQRYFESHGYQEVFGLEQWVDLGETEFRPDWGLSDRRLFELAKQKVTELHDSGSPFNLTLLTLDTHPLLYIHDTCPITTEDPSVSVFRCSTDHVADFVSYMRDSGYLDDTVVVIVGDHLKLVGESNSFYDELREVSTTRTIFNRIWTPKSKSTVANVDQFGLFPTILEALGYELDRGRAGVSVSAYYPYSDLDTIRVLDEQQYTDLVHSRSAEFYDMLWQVPSLYTLSQESPVG